MKSRLQKKEFFIPLSSGTQTGVDPRLPTSPTIIAENVRFDVKGVSQKRDALGTFVGNTTTDVPTAFGSRDLYMAGTDSSGSVLFFGNSVYEYTVNGSYVSVYDGFNGCGEILDIESDVIASYEGGLQYMGDCPAAYITTTSGENQIIYGFSDNGILAATAPPTVGVIGVNSRVEISSYEGTSAAHTGKVIIDSSGNDLAWYFYKNTNFFTGHYNAAANTWSHHSNATPTVGSGTHTSRCSLLYGGTVNGSRRLIVADSNAGVVNCLVSNIYLTNAVQSSHVNVTSDGGQTARSYNFFLDSTNFVTLNAYEIGTPPTKVGITISADFLEDTSINNIDSAGENVATTTNASVIHVSGWVDTDDRDGGGSGNAQCYALFTYKEVAANSVSSEATTLLIPFKISDGGTITIGTNSEAASGAAYPVSEPLKTDNGVYVMFCHPGKSWWNYNATSAANASAQHFIYLGRYDDTNASSDGSRFVPVGMVNIPAHGRAAYDLVDGRPSAGGGAGYARWYTDGSTNILPLVVPTSTIDEDPTSWAAYGDCLLKSFSVNFSDQKIKPVEFGDHTMIPCALPLVYTEGLISPQGSLTYPEGITASRAVNANGEWATAGGVGTYSYCACFKTVDGLGKETLSAPSPSVSVNVAVVTDKVTVSVLGADPWKYRESEAQHARYVTIELYRTSADGNDFYRIAAGPAGDLAAFTDYGTVAFTANTGLDTILSAKALYTMNGELENSRPSRHRVCCIHANRYFYVPRDSEIDQICYSKSYRSGVSPEFNEILSIGCSAQGGPVRSLESWNEKLYIGKERSWMVTYGEPLNDAGGGQGFAPPRIITQEAGVKYPTAAAAGSPGIFFVNSVDGLIYLLGGSEQVQYVGGAVRHYCETYDYDNVWYAPQDGCVRFSSATVGAPTLSYNYKFGQWSTFTGRYDDGIRTAFAAPVGTSNAYVDVVMDTGGNVYVQNDSATVEDFNVNISTSWISLNDIAGYGRFYKWTLVGGKKNATLNLDLKTAYDYEAYWTDSQTYSANALEASEISDQYGAMTDANFVDQALKIEVDGSRHKTDAVRLCVSTNAGTARDDIEILGARLEIGVKPGSTKLGSGRTVS